MSVLNLPSFGAVRIASAAEEGERLGDYDRSESGRMRSDSVGSAEAWRFVTGEYSLDDARAIKAELMGAPPITVSGNAIGGPTPVHPRRVRLSYLADGDDMVATVSFDLHRTTPE